MAESKLKIAKKYIVNQGTPEEQCYDDVTECYVGYMRDVYIVRQGEKYGIIDETGKVITPIVYDALYHVNEPSEEYFYAKKDGKSGMITSDNQVISPFLYDGIDYQQVLFGEIKMVSFYDKATRKYGVAKWPSGEMLHEAQWDTVVLVREFQRYFLCGVNAPSKVSRYRWNIVNGSGKKLFDSCKYAHICGYGYYNYNVAITNATDYSPITGFYNYDAEVFYRDGTVIYEGKCNRIERVDYYDNAFVVESPGNYGVNDEYSLHIYYLNEDGEHRLYHQEFKHGGFSAVNYASELIRSSPELQAMVKKS